MVPRPSLYLDVCYANLCVVYKTGSVSLCLSVHVCMCVCVCTCVCVCVCVCTHMCASEQCMRASTCPHLHFLQTDTHPWGCMQPVGEAGERRLPTVGPDEAVIKLARQQIKSALAASREQASALLCELSDHFSELLPLLPETSIQVRTWQCSCFGCTVIGQGWLHIVQVAIACILSVV
jgi:hypothetical protein